MSSRIPVSSMDTVPDVREPGIAERLAGPSDGLLAELGREGSVPLVSVIILNYNGLKFAEQCLRSVLESDYPNFEIIVADNGSSDGSYEFLCQAFGTIHNVRIVRNSRNLGFAEGNNVGYRNSSGDIVVFLNIDTKVRSDWLGPLVWSMVSDDKVGGAQCKLLKMNCAQGVDSMGGVLDSLGYVYPSRCEYHGEPSEIFYAEGAAMAFKRKVIQEVAFDSKPFDQKNFLYYEDSDLSWRMRLRGYKIIIVPSSVVYHYRGGAGARDLGDMRTYYFTRNHFLTLVKNYDLRNLAFKLLILLVIELTHSATLLIGEPKMGLAKLRAIFWCFRNLRGAWAKRFYVQTKVRRVSDREVICRMRRPNLLAARASASIYY